MNNVTHKIDQVADEKLEKALFRARNFRRTEMSPDAPAPRLERVIEAQGERLTTRAIEAYGARLGGMPIIDIAHQMGVSLEVAKALIHEAHEAIAGDIKDQLALNRELDLGRIDGLIQAFYPSAKAGDDKSATVVLKCLQHRSKLTGTEPPPDPGRTSQPTNILIWLQNQLPSINQIVDALPLE